MTEGIKKWGTGFMDWIDNRMMIRRIILAITMYLVVDSYIWAKNYAWLASRSGSDIALVVVAVTAPATLLLKFVLDNYAGAKR